jgi:hypothetical protein
MLSAGRHQVPRLRKIGMTVYRRVETNVRSCFMVVPAECRDPSLGVLGFAKDSAVSG